MYIYILYTYKISLITFDRCPHCAQRQTSLSFILLQLHHYQSISKQSSHAVVLDFDAMPFQRGSLLGVTC